MTDQIAIMAASTRIASINRALAGLIGERLTDRGVGVDMVDLADHEMPMYHGDLEAESGPPHAAVTLVGRLAAVSTLVIVTPEYNGAFPPLLKNTIDWLTRVDREVLRGPVVLLASATPGRGGGRRVLSITRTWLENMRVEVADDVLGVPVAALADGRLTGADPQALDRFVERVIESAAREAAVDGS